MTNSIKGLGLWCAEQTTDYDTDPSANGSGFVGLPADQIGLLRYGEQQTPQQAYTGRPFGSPTLSTGQFWELPNVRIPLSGFISNTGDGYDPAASHVDDGIDAVLKHLTGVVRDIVGEGVDVGTTVNNLITDGADEFNADDIIPIRQAGLALQRVQWARVTTKNSATDYDIAPDMTQLVTNAAVCPGVRLFRPQSDGGLPLAFVYRQDQADFTLIGGRATSGRIVMNAREGVYLETAFRGTYWVRETKASLPPAVSAASLRTLLGLESPVWVNGTRYAVKNATFDLGIAATQKESTEASEGIYADNIDDYASRIELTPEYNDAFHGLQVPGATYEVLMQLGAGVLTGSLVNAMCVHAAAAQVAEFNPTEDQNLIRQNLVLNLTDPVSLNPFQIGRC